MFDRVLDTLLLTGFFKENIFAKFIRCSAYRCEVVFSLKRFARYFIQEFITVFREFNLLMHNAPK